MRELLAAWAATLIFSLAAGAATNDADRVFANKAAELAKDAAGRGARLRAVQLFVRDAIRETDTEYG